ncbi:MAG: nucleoside-triphosphatase [Clostridiaceae bacterium]|nr:nucleoside-triphosphatase [Clostridiaceae bacterium]HNT02934.1 nucleoside-triphosphatase [Bacillota bacterium]
MSRPQHILICGERGVGKSTLVNKLLLQSRRPVFGFITKKMPPNQNGECDVYIHPANSANLQLTHENLVGICNNGKIVTINTEVFNTVGVKLLQSPPRGLLLMDELGFMESKASAFCSGVLAVLDGDIPVLAAVKNKETPFLKAVREHKNVELHYITTQNRDMLYQELIEKIMEYNQWK